MNNEKYTPKNIASRINFKRECTLGFKCTYTETCTTCAGPVIINLWSEDRCKHAICTDCWMILAESTHFNTRF